MNQRYGLITALILAFSFSFNQNIAAQFNCENGKKFEEYSISDPFAAKQCEKDRAKLDEFTKRYALQKIANDTVVVIPTVFHILHLFGNENISKSQVIEALRIMTADYRMQNADTVDVDSAFQSIRADMQIEFRLAQIDPDGNCTDGIIRYNTPFANDFDDALGMKSWVQSQTNNPWSASKYFNVYVTKNGSGGYSTGPSSDNNWSTNSGVVVKHNVVGNSGTALNSGGRYMTHESGHWFNLIHTWGPTNEPNASTNCNVDDLVDDTPLCTGQWNCPLDKNSCVDSPIDLIDNLQNFMDYSDCVIMFTAGQRDRAQAALASSTGGRNNLGTLANLQATGTSDPYIYGETACSPKVSFGIRSGTARTCEGASITFTNATHNADIDSLVWSFEGGIPSTSTDSMPTITYDNPGNFDVSLSVYAGGVAYDSTASAMIIIDSLPGLPHPFTDNFDDEAIFTNQWQINNIEGDSEGWEWINTVSYAGSGCIRMNNNNAGAEKLTDDLISPVFDFSNVSGLLKFSFKLAHAQRATKEDQLKVQFSNNCGDSWSTQFVKKGAVLATTDYLGGQFIPESIDDWQDISFTVNDAFKVDNVRIKFQFITARGTHLYIDEINLVEVGIEEHDIASSIKIYPNPISSSSTLSFILFQTLDVKIEIVDILGQQVVAIKNEKLIKGKHAIHLSTDRIKKSGIYFVKMEFGNESIVRKIIKK